MVQGLRICFCNAGDMGLIPGQGIKISPAKEHLVNSYLQASVPQLLSLQVTAGESAHRKERAHMPQLSKVYILCT